VFSEFLHAFTESKEVQMALQKMKMLECQLFKFG